MHKSTLLSTQNLSYQTSDDRILLHPTNIRVNQGDRIGLHGLSGSGKSVLLRTLALLNCPSSGEIYWQDQPISQLSGKAVQQYRTQVAYVQQQANLINGSVEDNLRLPYQLAVYHQQQADPQQWLKMLQQIERKEDFLRQESENLSGGERQLVCLMRILQLSPQILLLDEPTSALDPESTQQVEQLINHWLQNNPQRAYIWISHNPDQLQRIASQQWKMNAGKLYFDEP